KVIHCQSDAKMNGSQWDANASEVLLQDGGTRPTSTSGRLPWALWLTQAADLESLSRYFKAIRHSHMMSALSQVGQHILPACTASSQPPIGLCGAASSRTSLV
ncbi:MAG: hypothetical protein ACRCSS_12300, partial [Shewanella sp.]